MAHPSSQYSVFKLYQTVIDDVVNGIREAFLDEGVDEQVLQELRMLWESKLISTKAVENTPDNPGQGAATSGGSTTTASTASQDTNGHTEKASNPAPPPTTSASQPAQQPPAPPVVLPTDPNAQVPIQITMPRLSSDPPGFQRTITIHVPASCIHTNKLQDILSLPAIQATLSLPTEMAASALQGQINQALQNAGLDLKTPPSGSQGFLQVDGQAAGGDSSEDEVEMSNSRVSNCLKKVPKKTMAASSSGGRVNQALQNAGLDLMPSCSRSQAQGFVQVDGQAAGGDSSEDEDEDDDDDDDLDDDGDDRDDEREEEPEEEGQDEEPLNSDDDVSDPEASSERLYDIENVVVCQFDKITRTRNKWKFHLKDGIMNLNGKDYVFQKATGDAEW